MKKSEHNADAGPSPNLWLEFLRSVWPDDAEQISALQEFCGLCLTPDRRFGKLLLIVGPSASGKSTIACVLSALVGPDMSIRNGLCNLTFPFGIAPLIGKRLVILDAGPTRAKGRKIDLVSRLVSLGRGDVQTVSRKFQDPWTGRLDLRICIVANALPILEQPSPDLAARVIILQTRRSFHADADLQLLDRLMLELPAITAWAAEGLSRLLSRGSFEQPVAAKGLIEGMCLAGPDAGRNAA